MQRASTWLAERSEGCLPATVAGWQRFYVQVILAEAFDIWMVELDQRQKKRVAQRSVDILLRLCLGDVWVMSR